VFTSDAMPTPFEGLLWGTLPLGASILAILFAFFIPDRTRLPVADPERVSTVADEEPVLVREERYQS
jgi:hypothetical protein